MRSNRLDTGDAKAGAAKPPAGVAGRDHATILKGQSARTAGSADQPHMDDADS
jgi:hypothetical protein